MSRRASTIIEQAARKTGRGHKSAARLWLESNAPLIRERLAANNLSWTMLARELGADGYMDVNGNPPSPAALSSAWTRIASARQQVLPSLYVKQPTVEPGVPSFGTIRKKESS